jgi:hypothetical protein
MPDPGGARRGEGPVVEIAPKMKIRYGSNAPEPAETRLYAETRTHHSSAGVKFTCDSAFRVK